MKHVKLYEDHQSDKAFIRDLEAIGVQDEIKTDLLEVSGSRKDDFDWDAEMKVLKDWNDEHKNYITEVKGTIILTPNMEAKTNPSDEKPTKYIVKEVMIRFKSDHKLMLEYEHSGMVVYGALRYIYPSGGYGEIQPNATIRQSLHYEKRGVFGTMFYLFEKYHPKYFKELCDM